NGLVRAVGDALTVAAPANQAVQSPRPLVGIASSPTGKGYWTSYLDGSVQAFGDAALHGSLTGMALAGPVGSIVATADGAGYWMSAIDGGVFTFGDAQYQGSAAPFVPAKPIIGLAVPG